jgi:hypothetical protein
MRKISGLDLGMFGISDITQSLRDLIEKDYFNIFLEGSENADEAQKAYISDTQNMVPREYADPAEKAIFADAFWAQNL